MNEINYRQYIDGKFYYWGYGVNPDPQEFVPPYNSLMPSDRWTGMEDKRGVKIYERDIVRVAGIENYEVCFGEHTVPADGDYRVQITGWKLKNGAFDDALDPQLDPQVIGNIYETPELLEAAS